MLTFALHVRDEDVRVQCVGVLVEGLFSRSLAAIAKWSLERGVVSWVGA